jgi:DNA-binding transcriptional ArsR family regulator
MNDKIKTNSFDIQNELHITDYAVVSVLFHEVKQEILKLLIFDELTIIEISKRLNNLNPGTVKRHLTDLENAKLIKLSKEERNEFGINMKFYKAVAKTFHVNLSFP